MKLTNSEISSLCLELGLLLHAGMNTGDSLHALLEDAQPPFREPLSQMARQADAGDPLSTVLESSDLLPEHVWKLVRVGERTGRTEEALRALADTYDASARLEERIRSALLYPSILLLLMLVVIGVLLTKVLPVFNSVFESLGGELSGVAGGLLTLGFALDAAMPVLLILLAAAALFVTAFACSSAFRQRLTRSWKKRFGDRGIARSAADARFAQALAMGLRSGLPLEEALELAASFYGENSAALRRCRDAVSRMEQGEGLAEALRNAGVLSPSYCRMLALGIRGGSGDTVMQEIARRIQEKSEAAIEGAAGRVEPALVIATSLIVGVILLAVMLPLMNIMAAIG